MTSVPMVRQTAGAGAARAVQRRNNKLNAGPNGRPGWLTYTILAAIILVSAAPIYYSVLLASSDGQTVAANPLPSLLPQENFFKNINKILVNPNVDFWNAFSNSLIISLVTAASVVFFATLAGFAFSKLRFRGQNKLLIFVIATMAVPTQLGIIPLFIVMAKLGWQGNLLAVIVPSMVTAFGVFWMTQYLSEALPYELIEAARIDGCSMIRTFWHVGLPAARPAAAMLALFTFVGSWTAFFWPMIILGSSNPTLPVALSLLQASYFKDMSLIMAGVFMSTVPLIVVFFLAGKQLVSGIMAGAVKG